jgi:heptosyltransferase-1
MGPRQLNLAADFQCAPCMRRECDYVGKAEVQPACFEALSPRLVFARLLGQIEGQAGTQAT